MVQTFVYRDRGTTREFKLTPRRMQILWHIAYTPEVKVKMTANFAGYDRSKWVPTFYLDGTNIHQIVLLMKKAKLVEFDLSEKRVRLRITPLGMDALLSTIGEKS